jgi:hypothetical protein
MLLDWPEIFGEELAFLRLFMDVRGKLLMLALSSQNHPLSRQGINDVFYKWKATSTASVHMWQFVTQKD